MTHRDVMQGDKMARGHACALVTSSDASLDRTWRVDFTVVWTRV